MKLHVIGSSSAGNGYVLQTDDNRECLILECGLQFRKYAEAIGWRLTTIQGALVTHEHGDHAKFVADFHTNGIKTYSTDSTIHAIYAKYGGVSVLGTRMMGGYAPVKKREWTQIGGFSVMAVSSVHDAADPVNYIIRHPECGDILFITDTALFPYNAKDVTNILIETNFDMETIENLLPDKIQMSRLMQSHLSIQSAADIVGMLDNPQLRNVVLIHLSQRHGDADKFKRLMMQTTPKNVVVAEPGKTINLNSNIQF